LENEHRDQIFLRKQILAKLSAIDDIETHNELAVCTRKLLRRKLVPAEYRDLLAKIDVELQQMSTTVDVAVPTKMPASDGQYVRHHSMSEKIRKDSEVGQNAKLPDVQTLATVCTEAAAFATSPLRTWEDVGKHAQMLAPMMGIAPGTFAEARRNIGSEKAASALFLLLQLGQQVRNHAAYFHSITIGRKTADFHPWHLLERLSRSASLAS
jgi:replication initiation protein RepC